MDPYIIIGTGVAGISAAQAIRQIDATAKVLLIGDEAAVYYSRPGLAYYLTKELPERGLFPFRLEDFERNGYQIVRGGVEKIDPELKQVQLTNGDRYRYERLLIATGSSAATLSIPGADLEGVLTLDNLADARRIAKMAKKARTAVVIGGGITSLEIVEGLIARGVRTHYFLRGDRYWANVLDESESRIIEQRLTEEGVQIHYHTEALQIEGKRGRVSGVVTKAGQRLKCQIVAVAVGIRPRIELAQQIGLQTERGILVNEYLQTDDANIYAAGDVAQVFDPLTGSYNIDSLWDPARRQGFAAGLNMAGEKSIYRKSPPFNVTRLAGLTTTIIGTVGRGVDEDLMGIARGDSETWRQLPDAIAAQRGFDVNQLRILVGKKRLLGAVVMGDQTLSQPLQFLIAGQADITHIRNSLLQPRADIPEILLDFWIRWRSEHATQQS